MSTIILGAPRGVHRLIACVCLGLALSIARAEPDATAMRSFQIPAQSLESGLLEFAKQSGARMFYDSALTEGLQTSGIAGDYPPDEALDRLLSGTGLAARHTETGAIALERLDPMAALLAEARKPLPLAEATPEAKAKNNEKGDTSILPEMTVTASGLAEGSYNVPNATTATKTDTPIMETPVLIQVVPRAVLEDQQVINVQDALKNVSGVQPAGYLFYDGFDIRGFDTDSNTYRNGLRQIAVSFLDPANLEQIEILKGPAAVLYGRLEPGGLVNLVPKRPLPDPYYSLQQQFGSYDLYRTTVDATGPILDDRSLLYRFNLAYRNNNSFRDFVEQEHLFVSPTLTWRPTERLEFNLDLEYQYDEWVEDGSDSGIPAIGNRPAPIPISRYTTHGHKFPFFDPLTLALSRRERGSKVAIYDRGQYTCKTR